MKPSATGILIIIVMLVALFGFYPTYFSQYPEFEGLGNAHHFHGAMMMTWFGMLIAQPFLISYKKTEWHRLVGKASYVVAPLVVVSIYVVTKLEYYDDLSKYSRERSLAGLDLDLLSILSFVILYGLAIWHRGKMALHMRYMICTGLLIFIPGLARLLFFTFELPGAVVGISIMIITYALYGGLIAYDLRKKNTIIPYIVGVSLVTLTNVVVANNRSAWWQWISGNIADNLM
jgi:hypothetical protein